MKRYGYFHELARRARETTNSKESQQIKNKLIKIGVLLAIIGFGGTFACFIAFTLGGFNMVHSGGFGFSKGILIPFFLIVPCAMIGGVGVTALKLGLGIIIAKHTTEFLDPNRYCPVCGDVIKDGEKYCDKCGHEIKDKTICRYCNTENELDSKYCRNCGKLL